MRTIGAKRHSGWTAPPAWLAALATLVVGCGGSTTGGTSTTGNGGPDGSVSGGSTGNGGSTSGAGGSTSSGGSAASGGAGGCGDVACAPTHCATGYKAAILPGSCCATCVSDCSGVRCASPTCPPGSNPYTPTDQCCPICGPDCSTVDCAFPNCPPGTRFVQSPAACCGTCQALGDGGMPACGAGFDAYLAGQIAMMGALDCATATDCTETPLGDVCRFDCGTAINTRSMDALVKLTNSYVSQYCVGCPAHGAYCAPGSLKVDCVSGQCVLVP